MFGQVRLILLASPFLVLMTHAVAADAPDVDRLLGDASLRYEREALPLFRQFCNKCHATADPQGDLDLERFTSLDQIRQETKVWLKVVEMLDTGEMPPKEAKQLSAIQKAALREWLDQYLLAEAFANAGDPGPVVLRRLSNAEYTYTIRDLTGVDLNPAREFPVDSAAGEGFTNTGNSLVMSPSLLTKYLDAGKEIARHAVLLPHGFRFALSDTPSDWTNETLTNIRNIYGKYSNAKGGDQFQLQEVLVNTNEGGRIPVDQYLMATIQERSALISGQKTIDQVALERHLSPKYLTTLWQALNGTESSLLLDGVRNHWQNATPENVTSLLAEIAQWQKALWKFSSVGHIGKVNGPTHWMEKVSPLVGQQEVRYKIPESMPGTDIQFSLVASDAGDGNESDFVVWQKPRLVAAGRPDLPLKDVRRIIHDLGTRREKILSNASRYLVAADEVSRTMGSSDLKELAAKHELEEDALQAWLSYLGIGINGSVEIQGHFTNKLTNVGGYEFVTGWGTNETPLVIANSSDNAVRVPGNLKPHSVAMHPSPTLRVAAGWRSPVNSTMTISGAVTHAHPECGNGVTWSLELRRGNTRQKLATGVAHGPSEVKVGPLENIAVQTGDFLSLLIGARDGNHGCDLTAVDLTLAQSAENGRSWTLSQDVAGEIFAGNPHSDQFGNPAVWHFYTEPEAGVLTGPVIPAGSLLARWQTEINSTKRQELGAQIQTLLTSDSSTDPASPDSLLSRELKSLGGPLFTPLLHTRAAQSSPTLDSNNPDPESAWGIDPNLFGKHPDGSAIDSESLCLQAPSVLEIRLPADLAAGCELVTTGSLHPESGSEGSVQLRAVFGNVTNGKGLIPSETKITLGNEPWTSDNRKISFGTPIVVHAGSQTSQRLEQAFDQFRQLFPAALCYTKIIPVDEVVTLTLFYREDDHLQRLMLSDEEIAELDRLWEELHFISQDALTLVDALEQLIQYATQDADPKVFEPLREPFQARAEAFRQTMLAAEPKHLEELIRFAGKISRRPLPSAEEQKLRALYQQLRSEELPHDEAIRFLIARLFISPGFLYRLENAQPGALSTPVTPHELATRLSYFLWSSAPDAELKQLAANGSLLQPDILSAQTRRLMSDNKVRRLATEFACQWLHIYDFASHDEKSEKLFPEFAGLRADMYEESIRFFTDLFQRDGSVLEIFDADHTFVNENLAKFYGIQGVTGPEWRRVDGLKALGRGGILGFSTTLAKQAGASRTSPILRGNWISEVVMGEKLPKPPKNVPVLPDDAEALKTLTERQLIEKHSSDENCAHCHARIDPLGFSLEAFDAIGHRRDKDLAGRPVDTLAKLRDGTEFQGLEGLRNYLLQTRKKAILKQFCKKLLGYALGRGVQLSDEPLLTEMMQQLEQNDYRFSVAINAIVHSRQFLEIRGADRQMAGHE